ncbi:hypothetical protein JCM3263A_15170 [Thermobifida fusca]|nr:daptide-type RiPP [Thermobifida fusca]
MNSNVEQLVQSTDVVELEMQELEAMEAPGAWTNAVIISIAASIGIALT